jgi:hypothetical protein
MQDSNIELANFFLDTGPIPGSNNTRLLLIDTVGYRKILAHCRNAVVDMDQGGYLAIAIHLDGMNPVRKLMNFISLRYRLFQAKHALMISGVACAGVFGISPDLLSPTIIFPLGGIAAQYAEINLLPRSTKMPGIFRRMLSWWAGCDISAGAVLVTGRKF